ncbi:hypothetical protein SEA_LITTLEFELLA_84 [Gordonia phage LittleFella]|nr:hypothetical protein SEA_LITTLEFELLA_84 [Gordonia phage LittleFella]
MAVDQRSVDGLKENLEKAEDLTQALAYAGGFFSVCWTEEGVFQSELALAGVMTLQEWLRAHKEML